MPLLIVYALNPSKLELYTKNLDNTFQFSDFHHTSERCKSSISKSVVSPPYQTRTLYARHENHTYLFSENVQFLQL